MNKRFYVLDSFRGLCAVFVVISHLRIEGTITNFNFFLGSGRFVEFFFVLSGFVLAHGYAFNRTIIFIEFFKSRFFRLYPLHFFMLVVMIFIELARFIAYKFWGFNFSVIPFTGNYALQELIPNILLVQSWLPFTEKLSFNGVSWSISIELYLYFFLYFTIVLMSKYKVFIWLSISVVSFSLMYIKSPILTDSALRGLSCFFGGAVCYLVYMKVSKIKLVKSLSTLIELFLISLIYIFISSDFENREFSLSILFFVAVIVFSLEKGGVSDFLKMHFFQRLGTLSYSIYLTQTAIISILIATMMILSKLTGEELSPINNSIRYLTTGSIIGNNLLILFVLVIVYIISSWTNKNIEKRFMHYSKSNRAKVTSFA
ncbi:acyltransferase family protein [Vibrio breoganii]|uniref:acyltransferase family protein n=1 Tax=Vibrio breoganii TaxID=553239 RepID=UPI000CC3B755|nr:acyltransferase [Vibrio breoganii]PMO27680.1 hypothetical protein BCT13_16935 [Vibrio breoganii]